jgi:predicted O-methyltransferase YrrM
VPEAKELKSEALQCLLQLYDQRQDLQEVYLEVRSGDYTRLINWAALNVSGKLVDASKKQLLPYAQWYVLLQLYDQRQDLQETYLEVRSGDYTRLINWAALNVSGKLVDASKKQLLPYAQWYEANFRPYQPAVQWEQIAAALQSCSGLLRQTLTVMEDPESRDISFHLPLLALLVTQFHLRNIVELGTSDGTSTLALLEAAAAVDGAVFSVDIDPCREARQRVTATGLGDRWTFVQGSDMDLPDDKIPAPIDLLFIDTSHLYTHTRQELDKFGAQVRPGGWIILHDYVSYQGVAQALHEYIVSLPAAPRLYPFVHQNGLAVLQLA